MDLFSIKFLRFTNTPKCESLERYVKLSTAIHKVTTEQFVINWRHVATYCNNSLSFLPFPLFMNPTAISDICSFTDC